MDMNEDGVLYLTKFLFLCRKFVVWEVLREEEFSPLKNGPAAKKDTAVTARRALYDVHRSLITKAGGQIITTTGRTSRSSYSPLIRDGIWMAQLPDQEVVVEISPLVSYDGEGLEPLVAGKTFEPPVIIDEDNFDYQDQLHDHSRNGKKRNENGIHSTCLLNGIEIH